MASINEIYKEQGYGYLSGIMNGEIILAVSQYVRKYIVKNELSVPSDQWHPEILTRPSLDLYNDQSSPIHLLLLGLTPLMEHCVGTRLLPTYNFFRVYRRGDICKVHSDRDACEHSMTLALCSSDDIPWSFEVGRPVNVHHRCVSEDFGEEPFDSYPMKPGDAVIYRGIDVRHGRVNGNPNAWSAHIFLHWVEKSGAYAHLGFEGKKEMEKPSFAFA